MNIAPLQILYFGSEQSGCISSKTGRRTRHRPNSPATLSNRVNNCQTAFIPEISDETYAQLQSIKNVQRLSLNLLSKITRINATTEQEKNDIRTMRQAVLDQLNIMDSLKDSILNNLQN